MISTGVRSTNGLKTGETHASSRESIFEPEEWPPDYVKILAWRQQKIRQFQKNPHLVKGALAYYKENPTEFIQHWCDTYDPRNIGSGLPARLPFILFKRQREMIEFLHLLIVEKEDGLIKKCRDIGATWLSCALTIWLWLFYPGAAIGWGSRKEQLVDKIGDLDSIFEKMRMLIRGLPKFFLPDEFNFDRDTGYMKIINPGNGASITGEAGYKIGRGGRKTIYFKDESSHYERPEGIEAALGDNTNVQIDISSVNGPGNVFHRKYESGVHWVPGQPLTSGATNIFVFDWRDHPAKTQEWYNKREAKAKREGLLHKFREEVDGDFYSSITGTIIKYDWTKSAIDAHLEIPVAHLDIDFQISGPMTAALDVADGGMDQNALAIRKGNSLIYLETWTEEDTAHTARRAIATLKRFATPADPITCWYDCVGVGAGVKSETNRLREDGTLPRTIKFRPWNAGTEPRDPDKHVVPHDRDSPLNQDFHHNLKAQAWWEARRRFEKTHKCLKDGERYPAGEMITIPSEHFSRSQLSELQKELTQPTMGQSAQSLKNVVNKTPEGTRSPNMADAVIMAFWPAQFSNYTLDNL